MQANSIYPYIVPKEYLTRGDAPELVKSLGNDTYAVLAIETGGLANSVMSADLTALHLSPSQAQAVAIENLERLFKSGAIKAQRSPNGPDGKPFILVGGHWAAAAVPLLPRFQEFASKNLGEQDICLSIPHQGMVMVFPKGDANYRNRVREFVKKNEGDERKPITLGLFTYEGASLVAIVNE